MTQCRNTMWRLCLVAALVASATAAKDNNNKMAEVFFRHRGFTVNTLGYVHAHMFINVTRTLHHMDTVDELLRTMQMAHTATKQRGGTKWLPLMAKMLAEDVRRMRRRIHTILQSAGPDLQGRSRHKRFIGEILGLAGTFLGTLNAIQLERLQRQVTAITGSQDILIHRVHEDQVTLKEHAESLNSLRKWAVGEAELMEDMAKDNAKGHLMTTITSRSRQEGDETLAILAALMQHRAHPTLLTTAGLDELWSEVRTKADRAGYKPIVQHPSDIFQCETSFRATRDGVDVFIHIPVARREDKMSVFEHVQVPMAVSAETMTWIEPPEEVIAWAQDGLTFRTMKKAELASCRKFGMTYLCDDNTAEVFKPTTQSDRCIVNLYRRDYAGVRRTCPINIEPIRDQAMEIDGQLFIFVNKQEHRGKLTCPGNGTKEFNAD